MYNLLHNGNYAAIQLFQNHHLQLKFSLSHLTVLRAINRQWIFSPLTSMFPWALYAY